MVALAPSVTAQHKQRVTLALDHANPAKFPIVVQQRVAAVGLVRLGRGREEVLAVDEHGHEDRVVGGVRVSEHRVVVQVGVALSQVGVQRAHRARLQPGAEHMHLQALGGREQLIVGRDDRAGEVARHVDDRRAPGAEQRVRHLAHDRFEAMREHRDQRRVELTRGGRGRRRRARGCLVGGAGGVLGVLSHPRVPPCSCPAR